MSGIKGDGGGLDAAGRARLDRAIQEARRVVDPDELHEVWVSAANRSTLERILSPLGPSPDDWLTLAQFRALKGWTKVRPGHMHNDGGLDWDSGAEAR